MNTRSIFLGILIASLCTGSISAQKLMARDGFVKFFSSAPLEDIEAVNNQVSSMIDLSTGEFAFLVPIKAFTFEKALMQEHFNENFMESGKYPNGSFKGKIKDFEDTDLTEDGEYNLVFAGTMNIHGTDKEIEEEATVVVEDGKTSLSSVFDLRPEDYDIKIPASRRRNISEVIEVTVKIDYAKK